MRHVDRCTVAASFVSDPTNSKVADKVGYALAPDAGLGSAATGSGHVTLAIPAGTQKAKRPEIHRLGNV